MLLSRGSCRWVKIDRFVSVFLPPSRALLRGISCLLPGFHFRMTKCILSAPYSRRKFENTMERQNRTTTLSLCVRMSVDIEVVIFRYVFFKIMIGSVLNFHRSSAISRQDRKKAFSSYVRVLVGVLFRRSVTYNFEILELKAVRSFSTLYLRPSSDSRSKA